MDKQNKTPRQELLEILDRNQKEIEKLPLWLRNSISFEKLLGKNKK